MTKGKRNTNINGLNTYENPITLPLQTSTTFSYITLLKRQHMYLITIFLIF